MEKPRRDGDDFAPRRKKYKAYLDNSDGPAVVSTKTSRRWKLRQDTGRVLYTLTNHKTYRYADLLKNKLSNNVSLSKFFAQEQS